MQISYCEDYKTLLKFKVYVNRNGSSLLTSVRLPWLIWFNTVHVWFRTCGSWGSDSEISKCKEPRKLNSFYFQTLLHSNRTQTVADVAQRACRSVSWSAALRSPCVVAQLVLGKTGDERAAATVAFHVTPPVGKSSGTIWKWTVNALRTARV